MKLLAFVTFALLAGCDGDCVDTVTLVNVVTSSRAECGPRSTLTITQVATGQLVRCTCPRGGR